MLQNPVGFFTPFRQRSIGPDVGGGPVLLDAVIEENFRFDASVTDHPIEVPSLKGVVASTVSDHVYIEPRRYTMRGVVSDYPITWRSVNDPYAESDARTRSAAALQLLVRHFERRVPFSIQTDLILLKNMVFESLQVPRNGRNSRALEFTAEIREVMTVVPNELKREKAFEDVEGDAQAETQALPKQEKGPAPTEVVSVGSKLYDAVASAARG